MPRMSKKKLHELSFFLDEKNRIKYNEFCLKCQKTCKQEAHAELRDAGKHEEEQGVLKRSPHCLILHKVRIVLKAYKGIRAGRCRIIAERIVDRHTDRYEQHDRKENDGRSREQDNSGFVFEYLIHSSLSLLKAFSHFPQT